MAGLLIPGRAGAATFVELFDTWRFKKGTEEASSPDPTAWRSVGFDDSGWREGAAAFFYGEQLPGTTLPDMQGNYSSVYFRKKFVVNNPDGLSTLTLMALSDDGFVAWINGHEVVRFNVADGEPPFNGTALTTFSEPLPFEAYEIRGFHEFLVPGTNVLAVQGFNVSLGGSSDFVWVATLDGTVDDVPPLQVSTVPLAGSRVRDLSQVLVQFSEPVEGVDAGDLLVNGVAATNVTGFGGDQYIFEFPPQPKGNVSVRWAADAGIRDRSAARNPFGGGAWTYVVDPDLPPPGLLISEFMADNRKTLNDEDGNASDWIEIANTSDQSANLAGWALTDSPTNLTKWKFPSVSIAPRGFVVVFASGKNRTNAFARLHTNFKLEKGGGYLALVRPDGTIASAFAPGYPAQQQDVSYGRMATDPLATGYFPQPTPGAVNAEGGPGFAPEVHFSRTGGTFLDPFELRLEAGGGPATVRYTLDDSVPGEGSPAYTAPLQITSSVRVRARAFVPGLLPGPLVAEYYVQLNPSGAAVTSTLPLVILHSFGAGEVPPDGEYTGFVSIYEPRGGVASLTNAPDLRTRARLNIRGSSTLYQPKRNYSVEFRDEREADRSLSPLGLPAESDWVLYAPNNFEPILIHNPLAYQLSRDLGRYAPRTRFVEVYVQTGTGPITSTTYGGIYVLMEKIKRGPDRVDIAKLEPEHSTPPLVTGGYILKVDRLDPGDGGMYAANQVMGFVEPKEEEMRSPQRQPQVTYLQKYLDDFGAALNAPTWRDPVKGWRAYVDEGSWIDHHLLNVLTFNVDALRLSAFFYKPREGKLEFGPAWDFDRALNSTDGRDSNPRVWRSTVSDLGTDFFNYPWWGRMFQDPDFWQAYIDRYQELRRGPFSTNHLYALVDQMTTEVLPAQPREAKRWSGFTTPRTSYSSEITALKNWLFRRLDFMDTNFLAAPTFSLAGGVVSEGQTLTLAGPAGATIYYTLDGTDPRAPGGELAGSAKAYTEPIPVGAGALVRARARDLAHRNRTGANNPPLSSPWSGPVTARFQVEPGPEPGTLAFTEILYRPAPPTAAELASQPLLVRGDFEFLEIRNVGASAVDLRELRFTRGVEFSFSTSAVPRLAVGGRVLLVRNRSAFELRYGQRDGLAGAYQGSLAGGGEQLRIEDAAGRVIAEARFRDGWEPATDGLGFSLVRRDETAMGPALQASAWRVSAAPGGSPGRADPPPPPVPVVVVNEVLTHTDPPQYDGIELANLSSEPAAVGGWWLTDDRAVPQKYRLPAGTVIPSGGFLWIDERSFNADTNSPTSFRLDSLGDGAWVFAADAAGNLLGPAHGVSYGPAPNGVSFGRELTCDGVEEFVLQAAVTPGAPNSGPLGSPVVISEVHYHPPDEVLGGVPVDDTALEFVELANLSDSPVPLYDPANRTNTWRLKDAVGFVFPTNLTLPAHAVWVVVNFDPERNPQALARFRSTFGVAESVRLFGPFDGSLPNSGARVELARPDPPQGPADPTPGFVPYIVVDRVAYEDESPWPALADGSGRSLQRVRFGALGSEPRSWTAAVPTPGQLPAAGLDADGDGMSDAWEAEHCLSPREADGDADADGDGLSNRAEYVAGTNPRDPQDVLAWTGAQWVGGRVELRFPAKAGRSYTVQWAEPGVGADWHRLANVGPRDRDETVTVGDVVTFGGLRFYRILTPAEP